MKLIYALLIGFFLVGCGSQNNPSSSSELSHSTNDSSTQINSSQSDLPVTYSTTVSRNLKVFIPRNLPADIQLDSIVKLDYSKHASVYFIYPIGRNKKINEQIKRFATKEVSEFWNAVSSNTPEEHAITSDLQYVPESIFENTTLTSYCFYASTYFEETAHPNSEFYSFTFENKSGRLLGFSDIFNLKTKQDTLQLIALINEQIYVPDVTPLTTLDDIDFNIMEEGISFNFGPYDIGYYAEGARQGVVSYEKLTTYLNHRLF